ncbi:carboxypeptidase-like regulatory domain-containing protein [Pedobacter frigiditerrae]|uniref:Carboxypeptidase-like regulatory domain-containing protein n=1 Tax=Pedobacter frigiditerrae TaxID=2530452 RepID=A0A4R0MLS1_9SPHI|nr:carboxypeptidase-like regulatory domain-containing protein [Pedobacter frigiditerrae]TCC86914.1 carboxypeptidase-like regulatory domain-containing protein [Pedobacter frigiditerrae]
MTKRFAFLFILFFCCVNALAQSFSITGTVSDKVGLLPGAAVYLSGYKIATVTDNDGKFVLPRLAPGNYDILVQMIGFLPYTKNVLISDKSVNVSIALQENTTMLKEVIIKPDPNRAFYIALFKDYFIGKTPNAAECTILNTDVLVFDDDKDARILTAKANDFLIIENKALGYRIKYLLQDFEYNYKTKIIYFAGLPSFEDLKGSKSKQKNWLKKRAIAYNGSIQHFFKSLYNNTLAAEGFVINKIADIPNTSRKPDSVINANIKRLTTGQAGLSNLITFNGTDSLSYWLKQRSQPKTLSALNRKDVDIDTLVKPFNSDLKMMNFKDGLYVIYKDEKEIPSFNFSAHRQNRPPELNNYQISVVNLVEPPVRFYANGGVLETRSLIYKGYWAYEKIADIVPMDYILSPKQ